MTDIKFQVGFCTTCKNRTQHLEVTLPENLRNNPQAKIILVNYNTHDHLLNFLGANHLDDIREGRLVVYNYEDVGPFKMAHAKNLSHRLALREGCNLLVNMDADNFTAQGFDQHVLNTFVQSDSVFLWPNVEALKLPGGSFKGLNGRIGVTHKAFLKAGGYDEKYRTWSPDDKDFDARLRRMGYERKDIPREHLQVVLHRDKLRFREYPHLRHRDEFKMDIIEDPEHMLANYGRFGMGEVRRNFEDEPIHLGPVPTRIFGIGWHKTATTSLHHALKILGFDSAHWKTAPWARKIWTEMTATGKSPTLEKHYALSDMPIGLLYKELDLAYPGSKFILTVRSESAWLESVRKHWDAKTNPFRHQWDDDAFSHRLHEIMYGTREFNADWFLQRYRRHNHDVQRYFRDRPNDLLVLNMNNDGKSLWWKLCDFLGCRLPDVPYPREFQTGIPLL